MKAEEKIVLVKKIEDILEGIDEIKSGEGWQKTSTETNFGNNK